MTAETTAITSPIDAAQLPIASVIPNHETPTVAGMPIAASTGLISNRIATCGAIPRPIVTTESSPMPSVIIAGDSCAFFVRSWVFPRNTELVALTPM